MPEAVIVDAVRTPIGRAFKGSLAQLRPDEMGAFVVDALLERNPSVDPALIEEVYCGCGMPQGLQAFNIGRIIALLSERLPLGTNGATDLALLRLEPRVDPRGRERGHGRPGRRLHRRRRRVGLALQRAHRGRRRRGPERAPPGQERRPGRLHRDGPHRRERGRASTRSAARTWTSTPSARRSWPCSRRRSGFFDREIVPVTLPDGTVVAKDDGPRASSTLEKLVAARARLQGGRQGHGRQLVPAERRRRRGARDVGHEGGRARA